MTLVLEMRGITKCFPGITANDHVDFQLAAGEIHALLGENGAGKTTLMHILSGLSRPDEGDIVVRGAPVHFASPRDAMACGIGMVHQHFMLVPALTVTENIILGQEPSRYGPFLDVPQAVQHIRQLATQYHLDVDPQALIQDLPLGLRQRVEILKALYRQATVLILDEPTAVLTPGEVEHLFETLTALVRHGTSIIFITHKLREVFHIAQRLTVLRRGRVVGTLTPAEITASQLAALMVGETRPMQVVKQPRATSSDEVVLDVRDLDVRDERGNLVVAGVSLVVYAGEILGIAGVQGNGQTELVEALAGLRHPVAGNIVLQGTDVTQATPRQLAACGVAHIPEDRHTHGMVEGYTIADNLVLNTYYQQPFAHRMVRHAAPIGVHAAHLMQAFDIRAPHPAVQAGTLSGGNQQKMVIARECSRPLTLLIAAQPTRGLDIGATAFIHQHLLQQRNQGCAILLVSADLDEILTLSDRIAVMYDGKILAIVADREASRESLGQLMAGVSTS
jgi:general nucleoside transport system ATP-binding protein